jgi:RimJ/RimL family protein N-acetyltransferase
MKSNNISIKVAVQADAASWANMLLKLDKETNFTMFQTDERSSEISKYEDKIVNSVKNPKSIIFFAVDNDAPSMNNIVGYLSAEAYKNNRKSHAITVGMGVLESYCSKGIGKQLAVSLLNYAQEKNIKRIEAYIAESNHRSINLVKKFGFVTEGIKRKSIYINDTYQDEYVMALTINSELTL